MALVEPGRKAPAFALPDQDGTMHRLRDYAERLGRVTCLIGGDGKVARRWDNVKVDGHAADVLRAVDEL